MNFPPIDSRQESELQALAGMYGLLAQLWLREVDEPLLRLLSEPTMATCFGEAGGELPDQVSESVIEDLAVEYCRLFVGPSGHVPPIESVWRKGQFQSGAVRSMQDFMQVTGYDQQRIPSGTMVDHLGVQLDVMGSLLKRSDRDRQTQDVELICEIAAAFFNRHLIWSRSALAAASEKAEMPFYRSMIHMTQSFLIEEAEHWSHLP